MKHTNPELKFHSGPCDGHNCECQAFAQAATLSDGWPVCAECGHTQHIHRKGTEEVAVCDTVAPARFTETAPSTRRNRKMATKKDAAPAKKAQAEEKGTAWLTGVVNEKLGTDYSSYQLRIVIRKLVKAGSLERGEGRYSFTGVNDPQVKAIVAAIKNGAAEEAKKERIEKAKETADKAPARRTRKKADTEEEAPKPTRRRASKKAAEPEPAEDDDIDLDEL